MTFLLDHKFLLAFLLFCFALRIAFNDVSVGVWV
ncbi:hypothetical protein MXMO3_01680 [Maritalea myrionectae]|uniref:Uncharacterized protein n=1 Tax=Maritalea myrionectae TaxID=454601 RepID=A0A2R4ME87_9HYPH|nr:hypothetical protein MXMO3_01680 [Maritalea myrionectae]